MVDFNDPKKNVVVNINGYGAERQRQVPDIVVYGNDGEIKASGNNQRMSRLAKSGSA